MLAVTHADALGFLDCLHQSWRHDPTNDDLSRSRARVRRDVLPALRAVNPQAAQHAVQLADQMRRLDGVLDDRTDAALRELAWAGNGGDAPLDGVTLDRRAAAAFPRDLVAAVFRRLLCGGGVPADRLTRRRLTAIVDAVCDARGGRRVFNVGGAARVVVERERVRVRVAPGIDDV
jgi:tRNA(Ile)-lysidine synthase